MNNDAAISTIQIGKDWFPEKPGGLDRYYYDLIRHLPQTGVAVRGFVAGSDRIAAESDGTVSAFAPNSASLITRWRGVRRDVGQALAREPRSLVVAHFALYAMPCLDLIGRSPFVVHFQGPWSEESRSEGASPLIAHIKEKIERAVYNRASRFIVLSRAFRQILGDQYDIPADRVDVIPGAVDCDRWQPMLTRADARKQLGWPADRPIVLVVRRLVRRMGLEGLIEGVRHLREQVPDALIVIAGKGPLQDDLAQQVRDSGCGEHVRLAGFVPDDLLPTAYRAADLTIVPSVALEGFGLVVAESLSAGTPVLVTNVGGLPETIDGLSPQCIIDSQDPQEIAATIADALLGRLPLPDQTRCMAYARENFDWSVIAAKVGATYRRALA